MNRIRLSAEKELEIQLGLNKIAGFLKEYRFHPKRRWRFDFANPERMLALEVEGGIWSNGRHTRGKGYEEDCHKYNEASLLGWRLLRFTVEMVRTGKAIEYILRSAW